MEAAQRSARATALAILGQPQARAWRSGPGDRVAEVYLVNADPGYPQTTNVINGLSDLILEPYGREAREQARTAVGMAEPLNTCVTIAAEVAIKG
jgi:hypothetical protein